MNHMTYEAIVEKYSPWASQEQMEELNELTSEYIESPYDKHVFLAKVEDIMCPYLSEEEAKRFTADFANADGTRGPKWSKEVVVSELNRKGLPVEGDMYRVWDIYAAVNMMYSDLYDPAKTADVYVHDGYKFVMDKDWPKPGKMKDYVRLKKSIEA